MTKVKKKKILINVSSWLRVNKVAINTDSGHIKIIRIKPGILTKSEL